MKACLLKSHNIPNYYILYQWAFQLNFAYYSIHILHHYIIKIAYQRISETVKDMHKITIHMAIYYTTIAKTVKLKKRITCKNTIQWFNVCFTKNHNNNMHFILQ